MLFNPHQLLPSSIKVCVAYPPDTRTPGYEEEMRSKVNFEGVWFREMWCGFSGSGDVKGVVGLVGFEGGWLWEVWCGFRGLVFEGVIGLVFGGVGGLREV